MGLFSGIGSIIGGIFGATQQQRAYNSAINDLRNFQVQLSAETQAMRQNLMSTTGGLSPAAQIAFEDMNRLLKEDAVSTGNLRSGAFALGQAELGRRVIADELLRQTQLLDLFGRQDLSLLATSMGLTTNIADATIQRGTVNAAQLYGVGAGIGGVVDAGLLAAGGFLGLPSGPGGFEGLLTGLIRTGAGK